MVLLVILFAGIGLLAVASRHGLRRASGRVTREIVRDTMAGPA
jgi:hypothetical protein